jgi:hypothetical protein
MADKLDRSDLAAIRTLPVSHAPEPRRAVSAPVSHGSAAVALGEENWSEF